MSITCATINKYLKSKGHSERLVRGAGYYYFTGGGADAWPSASVYVCHLSQLSVGDWLAERDELEAHAKRSGWIA